MKSPAAAHRRRFSITAQGVSRSDREMTQKSWPTGAPSRAPPDRAEVTPGTTSTSTSGNRGASWSTGPAMPYTPASPLHTRATVLPPSAASNAQRHRSISRVMGVV